MTGKKGLRSAIGVVGLLVALVALTLSVVWADGHQESENVGTDGGTLSFDDGNVTVRVPQGAASGDITITYETIAADKVPASAPEGLSFGSRIFALSVSPDETLKQLAQITVSYTADDIAAAGGRDSNVGLYIYDSAFEAWNLDSAAIPDVVNKTLTSSQTNLKVLMAIVPMPPMDVEDPEMPETGGVAPGAGLLAGIAVLGALLALGGGYLYIRGRRASAA